MSIAAMIRRMGEAGAPHEAIAIAVEEIEAIQAALDARRNADRDRKRAQRERQVSADVTGHSNDCHADVTPPPSPLAPPLKSPPDPLKITPPISPQPTPPAPNRNGKDSVRPEHVLEAWNLMADETGVHKARMTDERRRKLKIFVRRHSIDDITEAIWAVPNSPFLCGENDRGWKAGLDFLLQPSSFTKLIEGTYDRETV